MSRANDDAFPSVVGDPGLTIREYYAGQIMQGFAADPSLNQTVAADQFQKWIEGKAQRATQWADALIAALAKEPT